MSETKDSMMRRWFRRRREPDWKAIDQLQGALAAEFTDVGVTGAELVTGFVPPFSSRAWLVVATDAERDQLLGQVEPGYDVAELADRAKTAVAAEGLRDDLLDGVTVQSQETVDRDYAGSWFYALR